MNIIATALAFHPLHSLELHEKKSFLLAFVANDMVPKKSFFSEEVNVRNCKTKALAFETLISIPQGTT